MYYQPSFSIAKKRYPKFFLLVYIYIYASKLSCSCHADIEKLAQYKHNVCHTIHTIYDHICKSKEFQLIICQTQMEV